MPPFIQNFQWWVWSALHTSRRHTGNSPAARLLFWFTALRQRRLPPPPAEAAGTSSWRTRTTKRKRIEHPVSFPILILLDKVQAGSHLPQQSHSESQQQQPGNDAANDHSHGNVGLLSGFTDCQHHLDKRGPFKGLFRAVMAWLTKNSSCPRHSRDSDVVVLFLLFLKHCNQILLEAACGR